MKKRIFLGKKSVFVRGATVIELEKIQRSYDGKLLVIERKGGITIFPFSGESPADLALSIGEELKTKVSPKKGAPPFVFGNMDMVPSRILRV